MANKIKHSLYTLFPERSRKKIKNFYYDFISFPCHKIKYHLLYGMEDFFDAIALEINTECNLRCKFCPNGKHPRGLKRNNKKMEWNLIKKIINELVEIKFKGMIFLHFYNEPLTDERLTEIIKYIKKKLPKNPLQINSNGFLITPEKYDELIKAGMDSYFVTQYGNAMPPAMKKIYEYLKTRPKSENKIKYRHLNENSSGLSNRGGEVEIEKAIDFERPICTYPGVALSINYTGDVMVCCNDYHHTIDMGNLKKEKLVEVWKKPHYVKFRKELRRGNFKLPICRRCIGLE